MASKSKSKQEEAQQFLDDLDNLNPPAGQPQSSGAPAAGAPAPSGNSENQHADVLAFIDEITQKSSEPTKTTTAHIERPLSRAGTPALKKSTERVRVGGGPASSSTSSLVGKTETPSRSTVYPMGESQPDVAAGSAGASAASAGRWGWGSVWTQASAAYQQARSVVDEQVKNLPKNEQVSKWGAGAIEYAKNAQLDKLGQDFKRVGLSTLTDILNVVAPPISEHEVLQVWLSHDMSGYEGVESLVYRSLARIMEQVEGGDLIVNRGAESKPKEDAKVEGRNLNAVDGYEAALKLAQANLDELVKNNQATTPQKESSVQNPTTYSYLYLRVQPFLTSLKLPRTSDDAAEPNQSLEQSSLQFLLHISDPGHMLVHSTVTQAVPGSWLDIWEQYDWVEDLVAESLRVGIEVVGQDYVVARMGWGKKETSEGEQQSTQAAAATAAPATT